MPPWSIHTVPYAVNIFVSAHFYRKVTLAMYNTHSHPTSSVKWPWPECQGWLTLQQLGISQAMHRRSHHMASLGTEVVLALVKGEAKEKCSSVYARCVMLVVLSSEEDTSPWAIMIYHITTDISTRAPEDAANDLISQGVAPMLPGVTAVLEILQNRESVNTFLYLMHMFCRTV